MKRPIIPGVWYLYVLIGGFPAAARDFPMEEISNRIRSRIEIAGSALTAGDQRIHATIVLPLFYQKRAYRPAWVTDTGRGSAIAALVIALEGATDHGLRPEDYHHGTLVTLLAEVNQKQRGKLPPPAGLLCDLDLLASDAFLIYASHLLAGRVDPEKIDAEWVANRREMDLAALLQTSLETGAITAGLESLLPRHPGYGRMRSALKRYRAIAERGGWPTVPAARTLRKGDRDEAVGALRERIRAFDALEDTGDEPILFDAALEKKLIHFQKRFGLEPDGVAGPKTLAMMNITAEQRVRQIILNMERWRWLPQSLGERYLIANIAAFELQVVEGEQTVMSMAVIAGRNYRRTPVFSGRMTYLVLNPYWHVPPSLAVEDKLPLIRKNPGYLAQQHMKLFLGWGAEEREIDPAGVNWARISAKNFPYRIRQEPGPLNALGRIKFMFPNRFNVYLHDTPTPELFAKAERAFSSGCVRISRPLELATYLLRNKPEWSREQIIAAIQQNKERTVNLPEPYNVHFLYWTAWTDEDDTVHFRPDIYDRDKPLADALLEKPPGIDAP